MHILLLSHDYPNIYRPTSGFFCRDQGIALKSQGHQVGVVHVELISWAEIFKAKQMSFGKFHSQLNNINLISYLAPVIPKLFTLQYKLRNTIGKKLIDEYIAHYGKPDIIHLHVHTFSDVAIYAKNRMNVPLVYTEHFTSVAKNQLTTPDIYSIKNVITHSEKKIAVSEPFRETLEKRYNTSFEYLPNVYQCNIFNLDKGELKDEGFTFINVAYLHKKKNQRRLIKAFHKAFNGKDNVKLKIIGSGPEKKNLRALISNLKMDRQIKLLGAKSSEEIAMLLNRSHIKVLSSDIETFGVCLIEAMACGIPTLATKCGGPESIITDGRLGTLVDKDTDMLSHQMESMMKNYASYDPEFISMHTLNNYGYDAIGKRLTKIYQECIG